MSSHSTSSSVPSRAFEIEHFLKAHERAPRKCRPKLRRSMCTASLLARPVSAVRQGSLLALRTSSTPYTCASCHPQMVYLGTHQATAAGMSSRVDDALAVRESRSSRFTEVTPKSVEHEYRRKPQQRSVAPGRSLNSRSTSANASFFGPRKLSRAAAHKEGFLLFPPTANGSHPARSSTPNCRPAAQLPKVLASEITFP
uniref:Uncharacterized protein n=1 Tax=Rhipicephalus zambeziensis TaxID=60191 RepID=A0A224Y7U5_9ACAR